MPDIVGSHNCSQVFLQVVLISLGDMSGPIGSDRLSSPLRHHVLTALVDTGAQGTCITANAARKLGLEPAGLIGIQGVGGSNFHNCYYFKIGLVDLRQDELGQHNPHFHVLDREIRGAEFDCGPDAAFDVLLGMDVLSAGTLTISNKGNFRFSIE